MLRSVAYLPPSLLVALAAVLVGYLIGSQPGRPKAVSDTASNPRQTIFDELTASETLAVARYVVDNVPDVKTSMVNLGADGDYITGTSAIELIAPVKAAALAYVNGETDTRPPRYARVTVARGSALDVMEYMVGPLHGCDANNCAAAYVEPLSPVVPMVEPGAIPFEKRPVDMSDATPMALVPDVCGPLKSLLLSSFGPVFDMALIPDCGTECFTGEDGHLFPFAFNDIESTSAARISKMQFFWYADASNVQAMWLHPLPFSFRVHQQGTSQADWFAYDLFYCGSGPFASVDALLAAAPPRCSYKPDPITEGLPSSWDIPGAGASNRRRLVVPATAPAATYTLSGAAGGNGRLVEWQGWSFFATLRPSTGLVAMDVRFRGRPIAYELALTEAAAHYSGTGADQVFYLDSAYSMSQLGGDLMDGVDCPIGASYLTATLWVEPHGPDALFGSDVAEARPYRAVCVFEEHSPSSHWRHLQFASKVVDGVPDSSLVVRAVTAVGNYDYITEYRFHLDGSVRINFDFAGYMETRWFSQETTPWERSLGEVVHQNLAAPLHSHFGCFKVDLDLGSGGESLEHTTTSAGLHPDVPDLRGFATKYVVREYPEAEGVGLSTFVGANGSFALVDKSPRTVDDGSPTAPPGYMIIPGPTVGQALPDSHPFVKASAFSKYTLAVTRRKESEYRATSVYDLFGPGEPLTSLDSFIDGESLAQADLVAWVTLGKEHVPRSEDLPLISNFGTYFDLVPRNMHSGNAAMDVYVGGPLR